jgi:hypothetical protein
MTLRASIRFRAAITATVSTRRLSHSSQAMAWRRCRHRLLTTADPAHIMGVRSSTHHAWAMQATSSRCFRSRRSPLTGLAMEWQGKVRTTLCRRTTTRLLPRRRRSNNILTACHTALFTTVSPLIRLYITYPTSRPCLTEVLANPTAPFRITAIRPRCRKSPPREFPFEHVAGVRDGRVDGRVV